MENKRKLTPIRAWKCKGCLETFTNQNCIHKKTNKFILGIQEIKTICPCCKKETGKEYLGELNQDAPGRKNDAN